MTYNIKSTQLNDIEVLKGEEHMIPTLSVIDPLHKEFTNFRTFFCQELNFIKLGLFDVKQNINESDRLNCNDESCHRNALDEKITLQ